MNPSVWLSDWLSANMELYLFESLAEVCTVTARWLVTHNQERPHVSLGGVPPLTFLPRPIPSVQSPLQMST